MACESLYDKIQQIKILIIWNMMILKILLFFIPAFLFSAEVTWNGSRGQQLPEKEVDIAVKEYIKTKYPERVNKWDTLVSANTVTINGLMWQDNRNAVAVEKPWLKKNMYEGCQNGYEKYCFDTVGDTAASYCHNLKLLSYKDWRLPTKNELESIFDLNRNPAMKKEFKYTSQATFWSNTTSSRNYVWVVNFYNYMGAGKNRKNVYSAQKDQSHYVRCVRNVQ